MKCNICNAIKIVKCNFFYTVNELCDMYKILFSFPGQDFRLFSPALSIEENMAMKTTFTELDTTTFWVVASYSVPQ